MGRVTTEINTGPDGRYEVRVSVYSDRKPSTCGEVRLDPARAGTGDQLRALVASAGAAAAEYNNEHFGDVQNCAEHGRRAVKDFEREVRLMAELSVGFERRAARLAASPLLPEERERLERIVFAVNRGAAPTPSDNAWVNMRLVQRSRRDGG